MKQEDTLAVARYLKGDMEMQEMIAFESRIRQSSELRQAIETYKNSSASVIDSEKVISPLATEPVTRPSSKKYLVMFVVVALIAAGSIVLWPPRSSALYEKYAISRQMPITKLGSQAQIAIRKGADLFNEGKYKEARKFLQSEYMLNPQNPMLSYYFAITLVETGKEYEARTIFMNLYKGESIYKYDAAYYVALSFLQEEDKPAAIEWLKKIPEGTPNASKSRQLLAELKE
jgi:tetratricopeptide (TPR) repeat protein